MTGSSSLVADLELVRILFGVQHSPSRQDAGCLNIPNFDGIVVASRSKHHSWSMGKSDSPDDIQMRLEAFPRRPNPLARFEITLEIIILAQQAQVCQLVLVTLFRRFARGIANLALAISILG
jgi:hypothetical protein